MDRYGGGGSWPAGLGCEHCSPGGLANGVPYLTRFDDWRCNCCFTKQPGVDQLQRCPVNRLLELCKDMEMDASRFLCVGAFSMVAVQRCRKPRPVRKDRNACHSASLLAATKKGSVQVWCQRGAVRDNFDRKGFPAKYKELWKTPGQAVSKCCFYFGSDYDPCGAILTPQRTPGPSIPP